MAETTDSLQAELVKNKNKAWILFSPQPKHFKFSELVGLIDWYNNQLLGKSYKAKKIKLTMGERSLIAPLPLLPTSRIVMIGTGPQTEKMDKAEITQITRAAEEAVGDLNEKDPWFIISSQCSPELISAIEKKFENVTVG